MYIYQKTSEYFAVVAGGLEEPAAEELKRLGARNIKPEFRGIRFSADRGDLYSINYNSRLISRIMAPLATFRCASGDELYRQGRKIRWGDFLSEDQTFAVFSNVSASGINNSHFASLKLKDAVADYFMETSGRRPNVDARQPDIWFNLHIRKDRATVSIDTSGGPLHRRGYRKSSVSAPMQETLAAAIIRISGWDGTVPLYDPMCGSGTLLSEALIHYCRIPPGILRKRFGFQHLPDYDHRLWTEQVGAAKKRIREVPLGHIAGSDIDRSAVAAARENNRLLPHGDRLWLRVKDFNRLDPIENSIIVTNPPYGIRMKGNSDLSGFYREFGDFLKQKCKGCTAYIYFGEREYIKKIGLKASWKKPLKNGGLDGRLVKIDLY